MGLFSRKKREPIVHADVARRIHVQAGSEAVLARMREYDELTGAGDVVPVRLAEAGGWTTIVLGAAVHPWAFHNLAMWLLDVAGVIAVAESGNDHVGYWLVQDEHDSWLSGYDDRGVALSVQVPDNSAVHGDALSHPPATAAQALRDRGVPTELVSTTGDREATVKLEDPQHDLNPGFESTHKSRKAMQTSTDFLY